MCASRGEDLGVGVRAAPAGSSSRDGRITQARVGGHPRTECCEIVHKLVRTRPT